SPLHRKWGIKRLVVSTYQSITGTGKDAVSQYEAERDGKPAVQVYPHPIFENCIPHCDVFLENGYTREEMKLVHETQKILHAPDLAITATAVRVPVLGGHSESVNVELHEATDIAEIRKLLAESPGIVITDDPLNNQYPMPLTAHEQDHVYIGRLRKDASCVNAFNMWIVSDNLRKGAATNAVQLAEILLEKGIV
ncbi:MAG: aspartate-semialdehyde dehydrogenase, partial [Bacteroidetes bacterium]